MLGRKLLNGQFEMLATGDRLLQLRVLLLGLLQDGMRERKDPLMTPVCGCQCNEQGCSEFQEHQKEHRTALSASVNPLPFRKHPRQLPRMRGARPLGSECEWSHATLNPP